MARQPNPAHRGLALAAVGLATFMTSLDNTVVNVALPSIQRDLGLSLSGLEWIASAYVLVALGGHFLLRDHISWERWTGILLITIGVVLAEETPARTTKGPLERLL